MPKGSDRVAALRNLGLTFEEGDRRISKLATPTATDKMPTFVDANQIEILLRRKLMQGRSNEQDESTST
ncbi:uncharacterized protein BYT42DRAFT_615810 [Radiomyces spectabilis]|uniref:uncharacterized protein n=1 Tax=Radiomyces spectabilis TaxID=64574 RepID=UPI00221F3D2B|nr:uncharacterized protein BYT42DRAFT_615810 [Radiomyces spectabilis]KAI8374678.1 hypothetical protein BYT42DRAFT_615810 [Radiomyces spectabilis]